MLPGVCVLKLPREENHKSQLGTHYSQRKKESIRSSASEHMQLTPWTSGCRVATCLPALSSINNSFTVSPPPPLTLFLSPIYISFLANCSQGVQEMHFSLLGIYSYVCSYLSSTGLFTLRHTLRLSSINICVTHRVARGGLSNWSLLQGRPERQHV